LVVVFVLGELNVVMAEELSGMVVNGVTVMWMMAVMMAVRFLWQKRAVIVGQEESAGVSLRVGGQFPLQLFYFALNFVAKVEVLLLNFLAFIHYKIIKNFLMTSKYC